MVAFLYNNKSILIVLGIVLILFLMYLFIKKLPTKVEKKEEVKNDKKETLEKKETKKDDGKDIKPAQIPVEQLEEKTQNEDKKSKKTDNKPKIVQVYKREHKDESGKTETKIDPIYDRNVEFVNTSKNIAKFKSFVDETKEQEENNKNEETNDEFGFVTETKDDCEYCQDKVKHFDHSIRLSSVMKDDNHDNMFASHISDRYLNINSDKHLNLDENFHKSLFSRTDSMMINSDNKVNVGDDDSSLFSSDFSNQNVDLSEDEVKINMKTALIADTYFKRKKKK